MAATLTRPVSLNHISCHMYKLYFRFYINYNFNGMFEEPENVINNQRLKRQPCANQARYVLCISTPSIT